MHKRTSILLLSCLLSSTVAIATPRNGQNSQSRGNPGLVGDVSELDRANNEQRFIIKFKNNTPYTKKRNGRADFTAKAHQLMSNHGAKVKVRIPRGKVIAASINEKERKALQQNPHVEYVELDPKRYLLAEATPYGIGMVQANYLDDALTGNTKVCIIDTGYDLGHEDLPSSNVTGSDNNGLGADTGNWYEDGVGHGTHVAGTIAGIGDNGAGVVGVNPNGNVPLHIVKVFNNHGEWAYGSDLIVAVDQCVQAGSKVISMSLGGSSSSSAERNAFINALNNGVLSIAAAGNEGNSSFSYPASYDEVVSVAAVDSTKAKASFSQYNAQVEVTAPGVDVLSTLPNNQYAAWSGTSMATPHVAAVAALVWSSYPGCSPTQIRNALNATAEDLGGTGRDHQFGYGLVQAADAHAYLIDSCDGSTLPPAPPGDNSLSNGEVLSGLSANKGGQKLFTLDLPAGATNLSIQLSGGTGDADLYVQFGNQPTLSSYDCRPYKNGNTESCVFNTPQAGTYHIMLQAYNGYSGANFSVQYEEEVVVEPGEQGMFEQSNQYGSYYSWREFVIDVPAGMSTLNVSISGGSGDADLYVRYGSAPTGSSFDCRPYKNGNNELCTFSTPQAGKWYIRLRGYTSYSGVNVFAEWK